MSAIGGAGPAQSRVAKADNLVVPIVIAAGVQRLFIEQNGRRFRTQSNHAKRQRSSGKIVATNPGISAAADKRIDPSAKLAGPHIYLEIPRLGMDDAIVVNPNRREEQKDEEQRDADKACSDFQQSFQGKDHFMLSYSL